MSSERQHCDDIHAQGRRSSLCPAPVAEYQVPDPGPGTSRLALSRRRDGVSTREDQEADPILLGYARREMDLSPASPASRCSGGGRASAPHVSQLQLTQPHHGHHERLPTTGSLSVPTCFREAFHLAVPPEPQILRNRSAEPA